MFKTRSLFSLDVAIVNAYKLFNPTSKPSSTEDRRYGAHRNFRVALAMGRPPGPEAKSRLELLNGAPAEAHEISERLPGAEKYCATCKFVGRVVDNPMKKHKPLGELKQSSVSGKRRNRTPQSN